MSNLKSHCSLSYHDAPLDEVETFAHGVMSGYFAHNPPFDVLPFTLAQFEDIVKEYNETRAAYLNGGRGQKGDYLKAKTALMDALDELAEQTDKKADGSKDLIILAGYSPTQTGNSEVHKPGQPVVTVKRGIAGELIVSCQKLPEAKYYGCIMSEGAPLPDWVSITANGRIVVGDHHLTGVQFDLSTQRQKHFTGLTHNVTYYFYYYAVNLSGVSVLSEGVSMVCW